MSKYQSLYISKHFDDSVAKAFKNLFKNEHFDAIHSDHSAMAPLGFFAKNLFKNAPLGIRLHNVEWVIWQRYADELPKLSFKRIFLQAGKAV